MGVALGRGVAVAGGGVAVTTTARSTVRVQEARATAAHTAMSMAAKGIACPRQSTFPVISDSLCTAVLAQRRHRYRQAQSHRKPQSVGLPSPVANHRTHALPLADIVSPTAKTVVASASRCTAPGRSWRSMR